MSKNYTNKYGNWSSHTLVLNILRNSVYIGKVKFKGLEYKGEHEPIIAEKTFEEVSHLLNSSERQSGKSTSQKTPFRAEYLLSSLIYCGNCGARYSAEHGNYSCYSRTKGNKDYIIDPYCKNPKS